MAWNSLSALLESQALSAGDEWIVLATVDHTTFSAPLRLASPRRQALVSNGHTFTPTKFDVVFSSDAVDESSRASVQIDGVNGAILTALQGLFPRPVVTFELVLQSEPNTVIYTARQLEIANMVQDGITSLSFDLELPRSLALPFPGINMDRRRVAGMFTDL